MVQQSVKIALVRGLAARPAAEFVKMASSFESRVRIGRNGQWVDAKSILGVMSMALSQGDEIIVQVDGADEDVALASLVKFLSAPGL
ncbi:HPr family phosphocarrier protein [Alicyclobacillus acidoterrestris]|uniref:HPr family phosphocarrier protein n=1 Tax=Alicyclobacillus TaxID=29330 RepID=UPI00119061D3|nr:HPr family phosphocarrier protein [Alicyclobacillus suci]GEO24248.1 PTS sugar transporter subunit IIA [Alicyclobacillus acidoterrestris]